VTQRGVYFLANDVILEQAVAFLNSFRAHNPWMPLCLIPFGDDVGELRRLSERYRFTVFDDRDRLRWCDDIGHGFHGERQGQYRKLAIWDGPFDEFVYVDTDTVVLTDVTFVFAYLAHFGFVTAGSHLPAARKWVWKDSVYTGGVLTDEQISYAANTGFIASRRENLPPARVDARLPAARALAGHMELLCIEQPLLNYLFVTSERRYTSLFTIAMTTGAWDLPMERWAGDPSFVVRDGRVVSPESPSLMMHWAGQWSGTDRPDRPVPYAELWKHYRWLSPALIGGVDD
jgi:hypothetical protein